MVQTKKPKALILDDDPQRHVEIKRDLTEYEVIGCTDIWAAQEAIKTEPFDLLCLDFDLNDFSNASAIITQDAELKLTGADFLAYMLTEVPSEHWPKKVIIVSTNTEGAKELQWILNAVGIENTWDCQPNEIL
jgi:response regulator RpfG family c-di-GMP phosphodiesterase